MAKPSRKIKRREAEETSRSLASAWTPLRQSVFRALWIASVVSNIGSWMHLLGCLGLGAITGAWLLPKIKQRLAINQLIAIGSVVFALVAIALAYVGSFPFLSFALAVGGVAWISVLSSFNVSAQAATPSWVRARVMAVYLLVFTGGLAAGAAVWGFVAAHFGISSALLLSAIGLVGGLTATWHYPLGGKKPLSLAPSMHWPEPVMLIEADAQKGPAITSIEYRINPKTAEEFLEAMKELKRIRLRDGAIRWNVLRDSGDPERYLEVFVTESWGEHLRQHERVTARDREVEQCVQAFHVGAKAPRITHLIAEQLPP